MPSGDGFVIWVSVLTPESRGRIRLASPDPFEQPLIHAGYFCRTGGSRPHGAGAALGVGDLRDASTGRP